MNRTRLNTARLNSSGARRTIVLPPSVEAALKDHFAATLSGIITGGFHVREAPRNATPPYCVLGTPAESISYQTDVSESYTLTLTFYVVGSTSMADTRAKADRVVAAYRGPEGVYPKPAWEYDGGKLSPLIVSTRRRSSPEPDIIGGFKYWTDEITLTGRDLRRR